jgi:hypothetical protein
MDLFPAYAALIDTTRGKIENTVGYVRREFFLGDALARLLILILRLLYGFRYSMIKVNVH